MQKNKLKLNIIFFTLFILTLVSTNIYSADCQFKVQIEHYNSDPTGLLKWVNSQLEKAKTDQSQSLDSICYFHIGKIYYKCSLKENMNSKKEFLLQNAIESLEWAANNIGSRNQDTYRLCHRHLIQALCHTSKNDYAKIRKYIYRVPHLKPFKNPIVIDTIRKAMAQASYKNASPVTTNDHLKLLIDYSCDKYNVITRQTDPGTLIRMAKSWTGIDASCHLIIGYTLFQFSLNENDPELKNRILNYTKKYLKQASMGLRRSSNGYRLCNQLFVNAEANSDNPDLKIIYKLSQEPHVRVEEKDTTRIISIIENQVKPYITKFTQMDFPPDYIIDLYRQLIPQPTEFYITLTNIRSFKQHYQTLQERLKQHTSQNIMHDIAEIIREMEQFRYMMSDIQPFFTAYRIWFDSLQAMQDLPNGAINRCSHTKELLKKFEIVRQTLPFAQTPQELNCLNKMACLAYLHNPEDIMPIYDDPQRLKKKQQCEDWILSYNATVNKCGKSDLIEDRRPSLNALKKLHDALDSYYAKNKTQQLESIHSNTEYDQIKRITGEYIAHHYYSIVFKELHSGPIKNKPLRTLNNIGETLNLYSRYSDYMRSKGKININQQHKSLTNFFSNISSDLTTAQETLQYITEGLQTVWNIQDVLNKYKSELATKYIPGVTAYEPKTVNEQIKAVPQSYIPAAEPLHISTETPEQFTAPEAASRNVPPHKTIQKARNAFDKFEYFESWEYYQREYSGIVPDRLEDLVRQDETIYVTSTENVWRSIQNKDKTRLKLLSMIIKLVNSPNTPDSQFNEFAVKRTTGYSPDYSFHLAELGHTTHEKSSDRDFIFALYYMNNAKPQNQHSYEMIRHFLASYQALEQGMSIFNLSTQQRINKKRQRLEYWIKKVWNQQGHSFKDYARTQYYRYYPAIFDTLIRNIDNCNPNGSSYDQNILLSPKEEIQQNHEKSLNVEFNNIKEARLVISQFKKSYFQCEDHQHAIRTFINRLIKKFIETSDDQYLIIYSEFKPFCNCISANVMSGYDETFSSLY